MSYRLAPWCDALYICDWALINKYHDTSDVDNGLSWADIDCLRVTQDAQGIRDFPDHWKRVPSENGPGLSLDPLRIHRGANSGYQAINLAVLMGAKRIILLGYDMQINGKRHWHGDHESGLNNPQENNIEQWRVNFQSVPPDLEKAGVEVVNCSRQTALDVFPKGKLEDVI